MQDLIFPPLMTGMAIEGRDSDPFDTAIAQATLGVDAGLIVYNLEADRARATLVLAPDVALTQAMAMLPVAGIGFQNALGALAPPEVAVHLEWNGRIRVNGAKCGGFQNRGQYDRCRSTTRLVMYRAGSSIVARA